MEFDNIFHLYLFQHNVDMTLFFGFVSIKFVFDGFILRISKCLYIGDIVAVVLVLVLVVKLLLLLLCSIQLFPLLCITVFLYVK